MAVLAWCEDSYLQAPLWRDNSVAAILAGRMVLGE